MMKFRIAAGASLLLIAAPLTFAQYSGPGARQEAALTVARTVAEVLKDPVDDRPVELTGTLVRQNSREIYLFRDATGEIEVEIDREDFPVGTPVGADTHVTLRGEIDTRALRSPQIDVEHLQVVAAPTAAP